MKSTLEQNTLTLYFAGEINSSNAHNVEEEAMRTIGNQTFKTLVLNFHDITYVSSAGLRIVLMFKKRYGDVHITDISLEVYDVLHMTGFTEMMDVQKALAEIDVSAAELIGEGYCSKVYRINKDTIIKVLRQPTPIAEVQRELNLARQAFVLGIPTAISYDVVKVGDLLGVRFEMLDCASLRDAFRDHPEQTDALIEKYAALLKTINTTESIDPSIPSTKDIAIRHMEKIKPLFDKKHAAKLEKLITSIPERDTFVHGDCHVKNIMLQDGEPMLIDMDTLSRGHPIFELAAIYATYIAFEEDSPGNNEDFLGLPTELVHKIFRGTLEHYFPAFNEEIYRKIALASYAHMVWWTITNSPEDERRLNGNFTRLNKLLDEIDDLDIGL